MSEDNLNTENNNERLPSASRCESEPIHLRIRICSVCAKDETTNKFKPKGKKCIKCYSKSNNIKMGQDYFKKYYQDRKTAKLNNELVV